jgi:hypothetical protein
MFRRSAAANHNAGVQSTDHLHGGRAKSGMAALRAMRGSSTTTALREHAMRREHALRENTLRVRRLFVKGKGNSDKAKPRKMLIALIQCRLFRHARRGRRVPGARTAPRSAYCGNSNKVRENARGRESSRNLYGTRADRDMRGQVELLAVERLLVCIQSHFQVIYP